MRPASPATIRSSPLPRDARIAILGAGPSGLFAARLLQGHGYTGVELFEKRDEVAGYTRSREVDGRVFDFSTKFIASATMRGPGVHPALQRVLDTCEVNLLPSADSRLYDAAIGRTQASLPTLRRFSRRQILFDFMRAYTLLRQLDAVEGVAGIYHAGLARPAETILDWGERLGVPAFAAMLCFVSDVFSSGPSHRQPVGYLLKSRYFFLANYLKLALGKGGGIERGLVGLLARALGPGGAPPQEVRHLRRFIAMPRPPTANLVIESGYTSLFTRLVDRLGLVVHRSQRLREVVTLPAGTGQGPALRLLREGGPPRDFDAVIVALPPPAIAPLFPGRPEVAATFGGIAIPHRIRSWMVRATGWPTALVGPTGILLDATNAVGLGTPAIVADGRPYGISKEFPESQVMVAPVYAPLGQPLATGEAILRHDLAARFGLNVRQVLGVEEFAYPRGVDRERIAGGWFDAVERLQGRHRTYFLGEALSGQGVAAVLDYVERALPRLLGLAVPSAGGSLGRENVL